MAQACLVGAGWGAAAGSPRGEEGVNFSNRLPFHFGALGGFLLFSVVSSARVSNFVCL